MLRYASIRSMVTNQSCLFTTHITLGMCFIWNGRCFKKTFRSLLNLENGRFYLLFWNQEIFWKSRQEMWHPDDVQWTAFSVAPGNHLILLTSNTLIVEQKSAQNQPHLFKTVQRFWWIVFWHFGLCPDLHAHQHGASCVLHNSFSDIHFFRNNMIRAQTGTLLSHTLISSCHQGDVSIWCFLKLCTKDLPMHERHKVFIRMVFWEAKLGFSFVSKDPMGSRVLLQYLL